MNKFIALVDGLAHLLGVFGRLTIIALVLSMLYEVVARYVFGAPTLWAFDISYMLNGTVFLLGAAYALKAEAHVRIDFLSQKFPVRVQQFINGGLYLLVMTPIFGMFTYVATTKALKAFMSGELESVSPWAPYIWPFYSVIALGLFAFTLQFIAEALKYISGQTVPGEGNAETPSGDLQL